jgi:hypothetical protein
VSRRRLGPRGHLPVPRLVLAAWVSAVLCGAGATGLLALRATAAAAPDQQLLVLTRLLDAAVTTAGAGPGATARVVALTGSEQGDSWQLVVAVAGATRLTTVLEPSGFALAGGRAAAAGWSPARLVGLLARVAPATPAALASVALAPSGEVSWCAGPPGGGRCRTAGVTGPVRVRVADMHLAGPPGAAQSVTG